MGDAGAQPHVHIHVYMCKQMLANIVHVSIHINTYMEVLSKIPCSRNSRLHETNVLSLNFRGTITVHVSYNTLIPAREREGERERDRDR